MEVDKGDVLEPVQIHHQNSTADRVLELAKTLRGVMRKNVQLMVNGVNGELGLRVHGRVMEEHSNDTERVNGHCLVGQSVKVIGHSDGSVTFIHVKPVSLV